jgi:hypothetical protein
MGALGKEFGGIDKLCDFVRRVGMTEDRQSEGRFGD